jgi:4'-phosphopantetheinyl transferase
VSGAVVVHIVRLDADECTVRALAGWLSAEEQARADRFAAARERRRFIVRRAALRAVLADALRETPCDVRLHAPQGRRPEIAGRLIQLSTSSSDELALVALHVDREIGIDVERLRLINDWRDLAASLAIEERDALLAMPPAAAAEAFLRVWTRKEAYVKALGVGLELPLDTFAVSVGEVGRLTRSSDGTPAADWSFVDLIPARGYVAALAIKGVAPEVEVRVASAAAIAERHRGQARP